MSTDTTPGDGKDFPPRYNPMASIGIRPRHR